MRRMATDRWTLLAVAATILLLVGCLAPRRLIPPGERLSWKMPHQDKVAHLGLFAAFGLTWMRAGGSRRRSLRKAGLVLTAAVVLAVGTELAQGLEWIHRDPDALDALADLAGALGGIGLASLGGRG